MVPYYSAYHAVSADSTGIHATVTTQGYASVTPSAGCNLIGVTHTAKATNTIGSTGGTQSGPASCPSCYLSVVNNQNVVGVPGVVYLIGFQSTVVCSRLGGGFFSNGGSINLPYVFVTLHLTSGLNLVPPIDDGARDEYARQVGSYSIGPFTNTLGCHVGFEMSGALTPSTYTGHIVLHRIPNSIKLWRDSTLIQNVPNDPDDTSDPGLRDDDPQSGGSHGIVYDLDAPATHPNIDNAVFRTRVNFSEFASFPDGSQFGIQMSPTFEFFARWSCKSVASVPGFVTDVPGDNQVAAGTTPLSINLQ